MNKQEIEKGIAAYMREQKVLIRLIKKSGGLTASKFDYLFKMRHVRRPGKCMSFSRESFILGIGANARFCSWGWYLELLQLMVLAGLVRIKKIGDNEIMYYVE